MLDCIINIAGDNRPFIRVNVLGNEMTGLLDSGASCTILGMGGKELIDRLKLKIIPVNKIIKTADNTCHFIRESVDLPFVVVDKCAIVRTLIVPSIPKNLVLGVDFWDAFNIRPTMCDRLMEISSVNEGIEKEDQNKHKLNKEQQASLKLTLSSFPISKPGKLGLTNLIEHKIDTTTEIGMKCRARPISPYIQEQVDEEIDRMLQLGVIERTSPTNWAHPVVCTKKPSGKLRFCLDARRLNEVTIKDHYPLPYINRILGRLVGTKYLSTIDLSDAFWQISLEKSSRHKTAFIVPGRGLFQYKRMPFGLCNSSQTLCRLMDKVLDVDLEPNVFVYLDDIIVMSDTYEKHLELLNEVSKRLRKAGLTINVKKSEFCLKQIKFLGYILGRDGLTTDPEKVQGVLDFSTPECVKDVRRLLGLAGWYRRFLKDFSSLTAPLSDLLKKGNKKFIWSKEADKAFQQLKSSLISAPILTNPDFTKPFSIQTDASDVGIGAILTQGEGLEERVIAFFSQKLNATQRKYAATERECLAVVKAIEKFRPYVEGVKFHVITDCASLIWLRNLKDPASRLARWAMLLQQYEFDLTHRKGKLNIVADALSRAVDSLELCSISDDSLYNKILAGVLENPEKYKDFKIENATLYKYCEVKNILGDFSYEWKIYPPAEAREKIIHSCHDEPLAAHLGTFKTIKRVQMYHFWPFMSKDVREYVKKCEKCQMNKAPNELMRIPMGDSKKPERPWGTIAIDYMGPYTRSKSGNSYLLVVLDVLTKFCVLKPMKRAESKSLIKFVEEEIFLLFGVPSIVISDNGKQFVSKDFKFLLNKYGTTHWLNASYHPQHNPSERVNRVILSAIRSYISPDQRDWDESIPTIACALRTAVHETTKCSPYFANFGREMILSGSIDPTVEKNGNIHAKKIKEIQDKVRSNLEKAYEKYSHRYNLRTRPREFAVGEIVLVKNFKLSKAIEGYTAKLDALYRKCTVKTKLGKCVYELNDLNGKNLGKYHANDMKKFVQ